VIVGLGLSCQKDLIKNFCIDTVNNLKAIVGIDFALVLADLLMISSMVYVLAANRRGTSAFPSRRRWRQR
jgi:hypothetical protein